MITDWRKLEMGKHYLLDCGCTGEIVCLRNSYRSSRNRGFYMAYSHMSCGRGPDLGDAYSKDYGPYCNFFNHGLADQAMPAKEVPEPFWWRVVPAHRRVNEIRLQKFSEIPFRTTKCADHHDDHSDFFGFTALLCTMRFLVGKLAGLFGKKS